MLKEKTRYLLMPILILLSACNQMHIGKTAIPPTYTEETYLDMTLGEIDSDILKDLGYLLTREEYPQTYQSIPEMRYEE